MHSIKNILERNKIDTQSRADTYIRRTRVIRKSENPLGWFFLKKHGFFPTLFSQAPVVWIRNDKDTDPTFQLVSDPYPDPT
jgi:hypothetical protein